MSVAIIPEFQSRQFEESLATPDIVWDVPRFSWAAIGGPIQAEVLGSGSLAALAASFDRLRCPVICRSPRGSAVWWGYVAEVELRYGAITLGATLENMGNWATVLYSEDGADDGLMTAPAIDERSVAVYGIKEARENLSQGSEALAEARRDQLLSQQGRPIPRFSFGDRVGAPQIRYLCRGWWSTLWWRYYLSTATGSVSATQQLTDLITAVGQFFPTVLVAQASAVTSEPNRDGTTKAGDVALELLKAGAGASLRMLTTVTEDRVLRIFPEPAQPSDDDYLLVTEEGEIDTPLDQPLPPHQPPVGRWARVRDVPPTLSIGEMHDPTRFFLEEAEFTAESGRWSLTTRGLADVFADLFATPM